MEATTVSSHYIVDTKFNPSQKSSSDVLADYIFSTDVFAVQQKIYCFGNLNFFFPKISLKMSTHVQSNLLKKTIHSAHVHLKKMSTHFSKSLFTKTQNFFEYIPDLVALFEYFEQMVYQ